MLSVLTRDTEGKEEKAMRRWAETGVMYPRAQEYLGPLEAGGGKEGFSARGFRGSMIS